MSSCSMQKALYEASKYLDQRIQDGSKLTITLPHAEHVMIVALSAVMIARKINKNNNAGFIDEEEAFVCGLLHDVGRYIVDEQKSKYPHTISGYERCMKLNMPRVAQVCLTHAILDKATKEEYPAYTENQIDFVNKKMSEIQRNFYDDLIMLIDLHCRGNQVLPIQERLEKNKIFYNIKSDNYCKKYLDVDSEFSKKYNINIQEVCTFVVNHRKTMFKKLMPYCHGVLRYLCGDNIDINMYTSVLKSQNYLKRPQIYARRHLEDFTR